MSSVFAAKQLHGNILSLSRSVTSILLLHLASTTRIGTWTRFSKPCQLNSTYSSCPKRILVFTGVSSSRNYSHSGKEVAELKAVEMAAKDLIKVDFEVYGIVQGVFFRKHTQSEAKNLGIRGNCRNTSNGTVRGTLEGPPAQVEKMKEWLRSKGSPMSRIEKVEFENQENIALYTFKESFQIQRTT